MASSDQHYIGCGFNTSSIFKTYSGVFSHVSPSVQSGTRAMVYSLVQFSKSSVHWLESDACIHSSGVRLEVHKQIYGVTFLSFSFSVVPVLSSSLSLPFLIPWPES